MVLFCARGRMKQTVNILGTEYEIFCLERKDDEHLKDFDGYCDAVSRFIVVRNFKDADDDAINVKDVEALQKKVLRHEIVHAFLYESGLTVNANVWSGAWTKNEEMIDWFAIQGEKIYKVWQEANCL